MYFIADNVEDETYEYLKKLCYNNQIFRTNLGNTGSFKFALDLALKNNDEDVIYFVEDDYLHREGSEKVLLEGFEKADYVSMYDHPDKYMSPSPNPFVKNGSELSRVFLTKSTHWKKTNSTCMTFASKVKTLKEDYKVFIDLWHSFRIFTHLNNEKGRTLITPIPGYSSHCMTEFLAPLIDWELEIGF
uniref:Uncharacterized protein n=1 Tax=Pithovirus LCPAC404 TaxID=2506597 RepID=A0A481ZCL5_9VIRU|nr:MAG: hypothetical protein LCPAC404_03680 [Pithovirus LCPAC404]